MSGGHFCYNCHQISQFAEDLKHEITINDDATKDSYGDAIGKHYPADTMKRIEAAHVIVTRAAELAREIEWLYSGDLGPETFNALYDKIMDPGRVT